MSRYITTKADFTLRRKHKKGSGTTIYENDYTTINPMPNALKGEYVIGDSNFIFTSRLGINAQKKHVRGKFVPNPMGENSAWTIDTIIDSGISEETRIRLKPNYTSIRDFACYGSAVKLVQGTVNGVITDFPAEMYLSKEKITVYNGQEGAGYSFDEEKGVAFTGNILFNEYGIDITTINVQPENVENPLRYFTLCGSSYTYIDAGGAVHDFVGFTVNNTASGACYQGKSIWVDKLAEVTISFSGVSDVVISIYKDYKDGSMFYTYSGGSAGGHIRPKKKIVEDYFRDCDDFTAVLLERNSRPIYMASFETPEDTDTGIKYEMKSYIWPSLNGGYNPDLNGPYYSYVESLMHLAEFYDEYFTDNMWRSLTHEAIKTLDWTYVSNSDGEIEEMTKIDTSRIEPITKIYGRQFDDLKRYADGIKSINTITYNQKSNTPDYTLTDVLENSGWETKTLKITSDNDISTVSLYSGLTSGYTASDANNEFLRRLKLNSQYLFSIKGTRKGLDTMLALFGFKPEEYDIHEYIYVASGDGNYTNFCNSTDSIPQNIKPKYPLAEDVSTINKYKINFDQYDPYGDYCGIPVAEIGWFSGDTNLSYVVPWYSYGKKYDDGLYFQMNGGWGRRRSMDIDLEIAPDVKSITEWDNVPLYMETQARMKFAKDFDELLQQAFASSHKNDVFYVTDISRIADEYEAAGEDDSGITNPSHYFVLENEDMSTFLGCNRELEEPKYGWRSIAMNEILEPNSYTAGTLVLYLESIEDNTDGNNPHIGNGTYDDGMAYVSGMSQIFNYSLISHNFIGINDSACSAISEYVFDVDRQEDNRKCWFFTDNYNKKCGKEAAYAKVNKCGEQAQNIEFREVDVTDGICALGNCNDSSTAKTGCNKQLADGVDIISLLSSAGQNKTVGIGKNAEVVYGRTSELDTFNPETGDKGENGEAAANSIINVKNIEIRFNIGAVPADEQTEFRRYIEGNVIPYLTQMIPSTSILSWKFSTDGQHGQEKVIPTPSRKLPPVRRAELIITPSESVSIDATGSTCLTARYVEYEDETVVIDTDVTTEATWSSDNNSLVKISKGCLTGHNETFEEKETTIRVTYPKGIADPKAVTVVVNGLEEPTIELQVIPRVPATAKTISYTAVCSEAVLVKCASQTSILTAGTFAISPNESTTDEVQHVITAFCKNHQSIFVTGSVIQQKAEEKPQPPGPEPPEPEPVVTYKLVLSPLSKTIEYNGTVQLTAMYRKYIDGVEDTSAAENVTTRASWTPTNNYATVNAGLVTGNNTDTENNHQVTIKASYNGVNQEEPSVITVKKKTETPPGPTPDPVITIELAVITPIDATATTINYTATTYSDNVEDNTIGVSVKLSNGTTVNNNRVGTLSIPANTETSVKTWTVQAFCTDHTDKKDEKQVKQQPALFINVEPELIKTGPTGASGLRASVKCNSAWTITSRPDWVSITTNNGGTGDKIVTFSVSRLSDRTPTAGTINFQVTGRPDLTDSLTVQTVEPITTNTTLVSHIQCPTSNYDIAQIHGLIYAPPEWEWGGSLNQGEFGVAYHYSRNNNQTGQTVSATTLPPMAQRGEKCIIKLTTVSLTQQLENNFGYLKFTSKDGTITWRSTTESFSSNAIAEQFNTWWENNGNYRNTEVFCDGVFEFFGTEETPTPSATRTVTVWPGSPLVVEHTYNAAAQLDSVGFALKGVEYSDGSRITYYKNGIDVGSFNTYNSVGSIIFTGMTTAATRVALEVEYAEFGRAGNFYGVSSVWNQLNFNVTDNGLGYDGGNITMSIDVPAGNAGDNTTIYLPGGHNPDAVFNYN